MHLLACGLSIPEMEFSRNVSTRDGESSKTVRRKMRKLNINLWNSCTDEKRAREKNEDKNEKSSRIAIDWAFVPQRRSFPEWLCLENLLCLLSMKHKMVWINLIWSEFSLCSSATKKERFFLSNFCSTSVGDKKRFFGYSGGELKRIKLLI